MDPDHIESMYLSFSATYQVNEKTSKISLVPGGDEIDVTKANLTEYLRTLVLHRLGSHLPLKSFVIGVQEVVPRDKLSIFSPQMLQLLVNGTQNFSVADLQKDSSASNVDPTKLAWLWECLEEMNDEDRALFLTFVTGTSVLPASGLDPPMKISSTSGKFPVAHTCFNALELPNYDTKDNLKANILFSIRNSEAMGFGMV